MGGKCYILFPNHKIEILYAILGCFTNLSIEGKSRIVIVIVYICSSSQNSNLCQFKRNIFSVQQSCAVVALEKMFNINDNSSYFPFSTYNSTTTRGERMEQSQDHGGSTRELHSDRW